MTARLFDTAKRDRATLAAFGRGLRNWIPRRSHGNWSPAPDRPDPVAILRQQEPGRLAEFIPIRYGRMLESPFRFFRGAAAVMAWDLSLTPTTGVHVQACGDAHALNFGGYASPERQLVFDINDFDETLPAPWEFDVKRLATSLVLEARDALWGDGVGKEAVATMVSAYCDTFATLANATTLQVHYANASADELLAAAGSKRVTRAIERYIDQATKRTHLTAFKKWVTTDDHGQRFIEDPLLLVRLSGEEVEHLHQIYNTYRDGLPEHQRHVLRQYRFRDAARKVLGVGSVGLRAYVILLAGQGQPDPLILQVKEATSSVLTPYIGSSGYARHGERVVIGQRLMQAASDPFLGFAPQADRDYYLRQLRDMKRPSGEVENTDLLNHCAGLCGATLARAHARSVDPSVISGYLGQGRRFIEALSDFAVSYADQTERDFARLEAARDGGEIAVENASP